MSALNDFPDPHDAEIIDDVIAVGGILDAPNLKLSYSLGIFRGPMKGIRFYGFARMSAVFLNLMNSILIKAWLSGFVNMSHLLKLP